jgi:hypothetical protein
MIPLDAKNYRARSGNGLNGWAIIGIIALTILLAWMGERDREAYVNRVEAAAECRP